jgi:hypothetical protein
MEGDVNRYVQSTVRIMDCSVITHMGMGHSTRMRVFMRLTMEVNLSESIKIIMMLSLNEGMPLSLSLDQSLLVRVRVDLTGDMVNLVRIFLQAAQVKTSAGDAQGGSRDESKEGDAVDDLHGDGGDR